MQSVVSTILLAAAGRAMSRDAIVSLILFVAVVLALIELCSLFCGFVFWGGARGQQMLKIYRKDDPTKFAVGHAFGIAFVLLLVGVACFLYIHLPEGWRG
jgi:hypothetical protein